MSDGYRKPILKPAIKAHAPAGEVGRRLSLTQRPVVPHARLQKMLAGMRSGAWVASPPESSP